MKKMKTMARQGDVLIISKDHAKLRKETKDRLFNMSLKTPVRFDVEDRLPVAYGEVSGHAHAIYENTAKMLVNKDIQETVKYLQTTSEATIQHEEHDAIVIPANTESVVLIQNEHRLEKIRRVAD